MGKVVIEKELGAIPTIEEIEVVDILVRCKSAQRRIIFMKPANRKGVRTPDIKIDDDIKWEIKSLEKHSKNTVDHAGRAGLRQAENLIFDLRKLRNYNSAKVIRMLEQDFTRTKKWKRLLVITKSEKVLTIYK